MYRAGQPFVVQHGKPWRVGRPIEMRGEVARAEGDLVVMSRRFQRPGQRYDGVRASQERGDHGEIELRRGAWVARRRYLRRDGRLIGELYNVNTATELLPGGARYVDLEVDVAYLPGRRVEVEVQDLAELAAAEVAGYIPPVVAAVARAIADEIAARLAATGSGLDWDVRPDPSALTPDVEAALAAWQRGWTVASVPYTR